MVQDAGMAQRVAGVRAQFRKGVCTAGWWTSDPQGGVSWVRRERCMALKGQQGRYCRLQPGQQRAVAQGEAPVRRLAGVAGIGSAGSRENPTGEAGWGRAGGGQGAVGATQGGAGQVRNGVWGQVAAGRVGEAAAQQRERADLGSLGGPERKMPLMPRGRRSVLWPQSPGGLQVLVLGRPWAKRSQGGGGGDSACVV